MLSALVDPYLTLRRATGFQMKVQAYLLRSFTAFAETRGDTHIRTTSAIAWAALAPSELQRANRLGALRVFARYAKAEDPNHEIPPDRVFARSEVDAPRSSSARHSCRSCSSARRAFHLRSRSGHGPIARCSRSSRSPAYAFPRRSRSGSTT